MIMNGVLEKSRSWIVREQSQFEIDFSSQVYYKLVVIAMNLIFIVFFLI